MPATIVTGKVPAWIQPRHVGLTSRDGERVVEEGDVRQIGAVLAPRDGQVFGVVGCDGAGEFIHGIV